MRSIVIVDLLSTGFNYVTDIIQRGYHPVIMETITISRSSVYEEVKEYYKKLDPASTIIKEKNSYEETLDEVKKYDPVLVLPGTESGVVLANRLAYDLGLPCNDINYIEAMTQKNAMHEALKKAGIRYIRGKVVASSDEAVSFCRENGFEKAVVKPVQSAGSSGLFLCDDITQVYEAVSTLLTTKDFVGKTFEKVMVQERIFGIEYIVNTVSRDGEHRLNSMARYEKIKTRNGHYIYDYAYYIDKMEPGYAEMVEYAFKVADAIHYKNGPIHGEYMIDEKGPVLIEVNCRPMGGSQPAEYMDLITGQHETDSVLDALLDPVKFKADCEKPYRLRRVGAFKFIIVKEDIDAEDSPVREVARQLSSTYMISGADPETPKYYHQTIDLDSNGGVIFMVNKDKKLLNEELELIRCVEQRFFQFLINDGTSRRIIPKTDSYDEEPEDIIDSCKCHGSILVAADEKRELEGCQCVTKDILKEARRGFDNVIIMYKNSLTGLSESACLRLIFDTMELVREGGRVIVPQGTYDFISYKRQGMEELMNIKGFMVEPPRKESAGKVIGTRVKIGGYGVTAL
ncbi:MAG: ATP-grasp domain-containing protein [Lachnospiraceae bacterium]|nr:ATP-grasp domain-containing protein [Lachnospiraceae bacterium]